MQDAVRDYAGGSTARFHMPGHKGFLLPTDVTEITGTDNLHAPHDAILRSEMLCAEALGAKDAFFSVNGSTAGILATLFVIGCGKRILLGRNCHKSVINGIAFAGHETVSIFPDENGIITAEAVDKALSSDPCDAVFITSPTYRGAVSPIDEIARAAHSHGALLFVDCAHGAHFAFSDRLPPVPSSADAWVISCHKTLEAYTQSALLLTGESFPFSRGRMQSVINMFQSTSPSYPRMIGIESSVLEPGDWDRHIDRITAFRQRLLKLENTVIIGSEDISLQDPTRLNLAVRGMTGRELGSILEKNGIYPEMSDADCVTLITTPSDPDEWYDRLIATLESIPVKANVDEGSKLRKTMLGDLRGRRVMSVRDAVSGVRELLAISEAEGRISAGSVGCYPPGVAVLFPGETITKGALAFLKEEADSGAELFGLENGLIPAVKGTI